MKWGVAINVRETASEVITNAKTADAGDLDCIWITDYPAVRLSPTLASTIARKTNRCRIGIGLLSPFIFPPERIVQFMSTLIKYHGNRFDLMIGPGDKNKLLDIGIRIGSGQAIIQRIIESLSIIKEGLRDYDDCHVFLGAQGPRMIEASKSSDGVFLNYSDSEMLNWAKTILGEISNKFEVGVFPPTMVGDHLNVREKFGIRMSAGIVALGMSMAMKTHFGLSEKLKDATALMKESNRIDEQVINQIEQSVIERFCISGNLNYACRRMQQFAELGVTTIVFGPPQGMTLDGIKRLIKVKKICL